jgi:hypothetical protein
MGWFTNLSNLFSTTPLWETPTAGASPYTLTNSASLGAPYGSTIQVVVSGGTVSQSQLGRKNAAGAYVYVTFATTTPAVIVLSADDQLVITYTVAPTITVSPI